MSVARRGFLCSSLAALAGASGGVRAAPEFPARPVKIVVPFPPGGGLDVLARALAAELTALWHQSVYVENIPGANSIIGTQRVTSAPGQGYTLLVTNPSTVVANRFLYKKLPYDPDESLLPVSMLAKTAQLIIANSAAPFNSMRDLIDAAKRAPGRLSYSIVGNGSQEHLLLETIAKKEGLDLISVAYKGVAPSITAVVSGEVQFTAASYSLTSELIKAGRIKPLALAADKRSPMYPEIPTTVEAGLPYAMSSVWYGMFATQDTPPDVLRKIHDDVVAICRQPKFAKINMTDRGVELVANTPEEFKKQLKAEIAVTDVMVKSIGLQPE